MTVWAIFIYKPVILKELIELYSKALTIKEIPDTREKLQKLLSKQ
jgi:hypothetical protein